MKRALVGLIMAVGAFACWATPALASNGVEHLNFAAGPYTVTPGANLILTDYHNVPKPNVNGFMTRVAPNLRYALPNGKCCGAVPRVDVLHLHHGVWVTDGPSGLGEGNTFGIGHYHLYEFMAVGEEKTIFVMPKGFGYPIGATDHWYLNYMIHNLWPNSAKVYITYNMDFIPDSSPAARGITPVHPIWMDVEDHHLYPVYDVKRYSGVNGKFTFPDMAKNPVDYNESSTPLNEFTVDHPGTLVATAGHVHPGGLYTDLDLIRPGAKRARQAVAGSVRGSVRLFQSNAHYWDTRGPISWDMAMTGTAPDWRPHINAGDTMRINATYETRRASWYESMGIMVAWEAWDSETGLDPFTGKVYRPRARVASVNPFRHALDQTGYLTHGHLPENNHHGGTPWLTVNPNKVRSCRTSNVTIAGFVYTPGDLESHSSARCAPTVKQGQPLTFTNDDASTLSSGNLIFRPSAAYLSSIFHTITACQNPCGFNTGISYPLANGAGNYDSGQLGMTIPAVGRVTWSTPTNLKPGTYTFFCRIHPFMRGVFRVVG